MSDSNAASLWGELLRGGGEAEADAEVCGDFADRMRAARLTFGGRLLCPFLRPFFLDPDDETRVARAAEALWRLGERLAAGGPENEEVVRGLRMSEAGKALARIHPGPGPPGAPPRPP